MRFICLLLALTVIQSGFANAAPGDTPAKTRVVVLGVDHSTQLVSKRYRPAVVEGFFDRVKPDAICVERDPENLAIGDLYEFTYEVSDIALPYVREHKLGVCPIDWIPPKQDMLLGFGIDLDAPPVIRPTEGFQAFLTFDQAAMGRDLFWAEDRTALKEWDAFADKPALQPGPELSRRLFLYRTALQARRIGQAARAWRGRTLLIVVGAYHVRDIRTLLAADPRIELVDPKSFGEPTAEQAVGLDRPRYLLAALTFNLLGQQAATGRVDWAWMNEMLLALAQTGDTPETRLLRQRLLRLTGEAGPVDTLKAYTALWSTTPAEARFTWTGIKDFQRIDSFFDPFGNLTIRQRIRVEMARELIALRRTREAEAILRELATALTPAKAAQLKGYWPMLQPSASAKR